MSEAPPPEKTLVDDPAIDGEVSLLRQVNPNDTAGMVDWDQVDADGSPTVRSAAFQRASRKAATREGYPERTMSVFLEEAVIEQYGSVEQWLSATGRPNWGVVRVEARWFRHFGKMAIMRDDHRGLVGHAVAWAADSGGKADAAQPDLAANSTWVVLPRRD